MTRQDFWSHIEQIDKNSLHNGDEDAAIEPLEARLLSLVPAELESFEEHLSQCLYALDGQVYANESGGSGHSADAFLYARCFIVAQGQQHFEATLRNPTLMPKSLDEWCESLLYVHQRAWAEMTGSDESEWSFEPTISYETATNKGLWPELELIQNVAAENPYVEQMFSRAATRAGHAFKARKFDQVVSLLSNHEPSLSTKQQRMLREAKNQLRL